jgi:serine/threonine protein kinase
VTPERWRRINEIFHAALEREGAARSAFVRQAAAGDLALLREVESLLNSHSHAGAFLDVPAYGVAPELMFDESESLVGRQVGVYRVTEEIGRGGMGVVYAAEDSRLHRQVALKALTPEYTRDANRRERLTREARAAAALSHPAIATIFSLEEIDGDLYIVSELVRGRTLREELADGPLPPDRLIPTLIDIASALSAAHQSGIVHRDLKPENIIRRTDGQIKVLDFGLASVDVGTGRETKSRLTQTGIALGTPGYMAPEQLSGGVVDARTDLFAFGVLAWELTTGEHPFGADPAALLARMTDLMEGRVSTVSRPLPVEGIDRIARRCMRGAPGERYQSAEALLDELRALLSAPRESGSLAAAHDQRLWWWQVHQVVIAVVHASMPIAAWVMRRSIDGPWGRVIFFMTLALATISVTIRLNLWFSARVDRDGLAEHRARVFPTVVATELLLVLVLLSAAAFVAATYEEFAALIVIVAVASLASLILIEPATTKSAGLLRDSRRRP